MNLKWALFFSGQATNVQAVLTQYSQKWRHQPLLITDNPKSRGIEVGRDFDLETHVLARPLNYQDLNLFLRNHKVDLIFLLGFLKIIPESFLNHWPDQIFNLHPSLLPDYPGLKSIQRAFDDKNDIGISIHKVIKGVDQGEVLMQERVFKKGSYDPLSLDEVQSIVHSEEHKLVCKFIPFCEERFGSKI